eukprot:14453600-Heterocapsa_arctica.AAC.1
MGTGDRGRIGATRLRGRRPFPDRGGPRLSRELPSKRQDVSRAKGGAAIGQLHVFTKAINA